VNVAPSGSVDMTSSTNGHNGKYHPPLVAAPPEEPKRTLEPSLLWSVFRKWTKVSVFGGLVLASGIAAVVWYLHVPKYRAMYMVKMTDTQKGILTTVQQTEAFVQNQRVLLRSSILLNRLLQHPEIANLPDLSRELEPITWLQKRLDVRQEAGSNIFTVSCEADQPQQAALILNLLIQEYFNYYHVYSKAANDEVLGVLRSGQKSELANVEAKQRKVEELVEKLAQAGGIVLDPLRSAESGLDPKAQALFFQLIAKEVERSGAYVQLTLEEERQKKPFQISAAELEKEVVANPYVRRVEHDIRVTQAVLSELKTDSTVYKQYQDSIRQMQDELKQLKEKLRKELPAILREQFVK
jgi:hypothetical protein